MTSLNVDVTGIRTNNRQNPINDKEKDALTSHSHHRNSISSHVYHKMEMRGVLDE